MRNNLRLSDPERALAAALVFIVSSVVVANADPMPSTSPILTNPDVAIDQELLISNANPYSLRRVLEAGATFYTTPFTAADAHGEGLDGPRASQRKAIYPLFEKNGQLPNYLKLNGLGAQSCFECHHSIGSKHSLGLETPGTLIRKTGVTGGSSGSASNAFINANFPNPITEIVRNPPHVFGTGYTQQVALEMSYELTTRRELARMISKAMGVGGTYNIPDGKFTAKGQSFGSFSTSYTAANTWEDNVSEVTGVLGDLIVRPLQWKGIASSIRHFIRDATEFHFSIQAVEKFGTGPESDLDKDDIYDELSVGNITAWTAFVGMTRPPTFKEPAAGSAAENGFKIFKGTADSVKPLIAANAKATMMCAQCHTPTQKLQQPVLHIENPTIPTPPADDDIASQMAYRNLPDEPSLPSLINPLPPNEHSLNKRIQRLIDTDLDAYITANGVPTDEFEFETAVQEIVSEAVTQGLDGDYKISLSNPGSLQKVPSDSLPAYLFPRLPTSDDGTVNVPLFSDLRMHNMGQGLSDSVGQGVDVSGQKVSPSLFLSRPLWGVADTSPYLHDGRAFSLQEAIAMHKSTDSVANPVIEVFNALSASDQKDVITFLETLTLPEVPNARLFAAGGGDINGDDRPPSLFSYHPALTNKEESRQIAKLQAQINELSKRPTLEQVQDARLNSIVMNAGKNNTATLKFYIQESADLKTWTNQGSVEADFPLEAGKKFLRFALKKE